MESRCTIYLRDGSKQLVHVKDLTIKLNFKDHARLSFETRKPTTTIKLVASLKIYWMIHKIPDKKSQLPYTHREESLPQSRDLCPGRSN
jgi:hypothetical protein